MNPEKPGFGGEEKELISQPAKKPSRLKRIFGTGVILVKSLQAETETEQLHNHADRQHKTQKQESKSAKDQAGHMEGILKELGVKGVKVTPKEEKKNDKRLHQFGETYLLALEPPISMTMPIRLPNSPDWHNEDFLRQVSDALKNSDYADHPDVKKLIEKIDQRKPAVNKTESLAKNQVSAETGNSILKEMGLGKMYDVISYKGTLWLVEKGEKQPGENSTKLSALSKDYLKKELFNILTQ